MKKAAHFDPNSGDLQIGPSSKSSVDGRKANVNGKSNDNALEQEDDASRSHSHEHHHHHDSLASTGPSHNHVHSHKHEHAEEHLHSHGHSHQHDHDHSHNHNHSHDHNHDNSHHHHHHQHSHNHGIERPAVARNPPLMRDAGIGKLLFIDARIAGMAGDMLVASLLDLGVPENVLSENLCKLPLEFSFRFVATSRSAISAPW